MTAAVEAQQSLRLSVRCEDVSLDESAKKNYGKLTDTIKAWNETTSGAYDGIKVIKQLGVLFGSDHLVKQANGYIAGTALWRVFPTAKTFTDSCSKISQLKYEKLISHWVQRVSSFAHEFFDFIAMSTYSLAFFIRNSTPFLNAGTCLNFACDLTDVVNFGSQSYNALARRSALVTLGRPELVRANEDSLENHLLKLVKSVAALVGTIFACGALYFGAPLIVPAAAAVIALTAAMFNIGAYYHKNYSCPAMLKVGFLASAQA